MYRDPTVWKLKYFALRDGDLPSTARALASDKVWYTMGVNGDLT